MKHFRLILGLGVVLVLGLTLAALQFGRLTTPPPTPSLAPSYAQIQQDIEQIAATTPYSDAMELGPDHVETPLEQEVGKYTLAVLRDKKVAGWQGWLKAFTYDDSNESYNLSISMRDPAAKDAENYNDGVDLSSVPAAQVKALRLGINLQLGINLPRSFYEWQKAWPRVEFSGTIWTAESNGRVIMYCEQVKRID